MGNTARPRTGRKVLRTVVSVILIAAAFGFVLPHVASYRSVWATVTLMTWPYALLVATAAVASMAAYWVTIRAVLPWIGIRQAAAVSLGSNAVANALPAGGALAMGISWAMLSSWGLSTADYVLYTLVTGIWNVFTLLGLPVIALLVMATATRPDAVLITAAAVGVAVLAGLIGGLGLLLHSDTLLGLVGILTAGAGHSDSVQVTAAVLLYRAVTYLPPIPLGALACLSWRHAPALLGARRREPVPAVQRDDGSLQPAPPR